MRAWALAAVLFVAHALSFGSYVADDAGISLAYARSLAHGHGLVLTPGSEPVEGYSNPLWVGILSLAVRAGADIQQPQFLFKSLGIALGLATIALLALWPRMTDPHARGGPIWIAPVLVALSTPFAFWSVAGLENALYAFLILAAAVLYIRELRSGRSPIGSAAALVGVALTRPEGIAIAAAFALHRGALLLFDRERNGRAIVRALAWLGGITVAYGGFLLWRFWYFGAWLPNTYYAKLGSRRLSRLPEYLLYPDDPGWKYVIGFVADAGPLVIALAAVGLLDVPRWRLNLLLAGVLSTVALYVLYVGGDWWPAHRFIGPVVPLVAIAAQQGLALLLRTVRNRHAAAALAALAVAAAIPGNARAAAAVWAAGDNDLVGFESRLAQGRRIRDFAEQAHIADPVYLEPDIGGPSLAGGLRIVDLGMLADVHLARFQYYGPFFRRYIFDERRPDFVRTHSVWTRASRVSRYPEFARDYLHLSSRHDDNGLHGEFVRKGLFVRRASAPAAPIARWRNLVLTSFAARPLSVHDRRVTFTWEWRCEPRCGDDYIFHLKVTGPQFTFEREYLPVFDLYRTPMWQADEVIRTTQDVYLPPGAPEGLEMSVGAAPPDHAPVFVAVGQVLRREPPSAGTAAARPRAANTEVETLFARAEEQFARGDYDAAMDHYRTVLRLDPRRIRARHRLEDARERSRWIEYLYDTDRFDELPQSFSTERERSAPGARELIEDLEILRTAAPRVVLHENGQATLALLHARLVPRPGDITQRVRLYFKVLRRPRGNYQLWLHAYPPAGPMLTWGLDPRRPTSSWQAGDVRVATFVIDPPAGEYRLRAGFWRPGGPAALCPSEDRCYLPLGTHRLAPTP